MDITNSIITEDGKDYLTTYIGKINNSTVDANALFTRFTRFIRYNY